MSYPFIAARWFTKGAMVEPRAIVWHMAEGWGTAGYFTRVATNVSSHFVVERSGRIVQCVREADASHTQHVSIDPDDNDAADCGIYSDAIGRAVLGSGWADVNRYVFGVEVEGFRADGPNAAQTVSIGALYRDLRARHPSLRGNLGHRDIQDYKSCPGCRFPWAGIDGHGPFTETPMIRFTLVARTPGLFTATSDGHAFNIESRTPRAFQPGYFRNIIARVALDEKLSTNLDVGKPMLLSTFGKTWELIAEADGTFTPERADHAAVLERARTAAVTAVGQAIDTVAQEV